MVKYKSLYSPCRTLFMIPSNITEEHILLAIQEIDQSSYPEKHESKKYNLIHNEKPYPPKVIISVAKCLASGDGRVGSELSGGVRCAR